MDSVYHDKLFYVSVGLVSADSAMQEEGVAFTEADGTFTISRVRAGSYLLRASLVGYETLELSVTVPEGTATVDLGTVAVSRAGASVRRSCVASAWMPRAMSPCRGFQLFPECGPVRW